MLPPAAELDRHPWSHSFRSWIRAIRDKDDVEGARAATAKVRNAATLSERDPWSGGFLVPWSLQERILAPDDERDRPAEGDVHPRDHAADRRPVPGERRSVRRRGRRWPE